MDWSERWTDAQKNKGTVSVVEAEQIKWCGN